MGLIWSNTVLKILIGAAVVIIAVGLYFQPPGDKPCSLVSSYPNKSAVYSCPAGLNTVALNTTRYVYMTLTTSVPASGWLTVPGDHETKATLPVRLGPPVVLGPGAFMAVSKSPALIYLESKTPFLVSMAFDVPTN